MNYQKDYLEFIKKYNIIGSTSIICDNKAIVHKATSGYLDFDKKIKTTIQTIYKIASISKIVVALGVMKLVEEKKLDLYEDISTYLGYKVRNPHFPNDIITIEMLMTQTSSLADAGEGEKGYYGSCCGYIDIPLKDLLVKENNSPYYIDSVFSKNKPGTVWDYCNFGCGILVCIVEKVTNEYFGKFIKDILLNPLHIDGGFKLYDLEEIDLLATHYLYNKENNTFINYRNYETFNKYQSKIFNKGDNYTGYAGGLYISGSDLSKIMIMLMNDGTYNNLKLFDEATIKEMKKIHWQGSSYDNAYSKKGLQMVILDRNDTTLYGHFGNACGLRSFMLFNNEKGIIFISNGANFISDEDHLTILLDEMINFMLNY